MYVSSWCLHLFCDHQIQGSIFPRKSHHRVSGTAEKALSDFLWLGRARLCRRACLCGQCVLVLFDNWVICNTDTIFIFFKSYYYLHHHYYLFGCLAIVRTCHSKESFNGARTRKTESVSHWRPFRAHRTPRTNVVGRLRVVFAWLSLWLYSCWTPIRIKYIFSLFFSA